MFEDLPSLSVLTFFALEAELFYADKLKLDKKNKLPDLTELAKEEKFVEVFAGWHEEGLVFEFLYKKEAKSDKKPPSVEFFIDTRDIKTKHFITKFCHHFICELSPEAVCREVTRFRADDMHPLATPDLFRLFIKSEKDKRRLQIFLPSQALFGYDIYNFRSLGFTYKINRFGLEPQNFSLSPDQFEIEKRPELWASMRLVK